MNPFKPIRVFGGASRSRFWPFLSDEEKVERAALSLVRNQVDHKRLAGLVRKYGTKAEVKFESAAKPQVGRPRTILATLIEKYGAEAVAMASNWVTLRKSGRPKSAMASNMRLVELVRCADDMDQRIQEHARRGSGSPAKDAYSEIFKQQSPASKRAPNAAQLEAIKRGHRRARKVRRSIFSKK